MVGDFFRLYNTESVGDSGYIPYIPNSPTGGHSGRKNSHGGRIRYICTHDVILIKVNKAFQKFSDLNLDLNLELNAICSTEEDIKREEKY